MIFITILSFGLSFLSHLTLLPVVQSEDGVGDLRIKNVQIWHEGRYTCTAQTVVDNDTAYCDLKVVGKFHREVTTDATIHVWLVQAACEGKISCRLPTVAADLQAPLEPTSSPKPFQAEFDLHLSTSMAWCVLHEVLAQSSQTEYKLL